jgi:hypothetical protein
MSSLAAKNWNGLSPLSASVSPAGVSSRTYSSWAVLLWPWLTMPLAANNTGAFADAGRLAEQAADLARAGGDLADASLHLAIASGGHVLVGDEPRAVSDRVRRTYARPPGRRPGPGRSP